MATRKRRRRIAGLEIRSDYKWRKLKYAYEVPKRVLRSEFDYLNPEEDVDGFFRHHGVWYHLSQFERSPKSMAPWQGHHSDSFYSGVVIRLSADGEQYMVGTFISASE